MYLSAFADATSDLASAIQAEFAPAMNALRAAQAIPVTVSNYTVGPLYSPQPDPAAAKKAAIAAAARLIPAWFPQGMPPFSDLSQGANGNTGYVSFRVLNRNGVQLWNVPESYKLNEGVQTITDSMAQAAGGFRVLPSVSTPGTMAGPGTFRVGSFIFLTDPRAQLTQFVGKVGGGYVPGISGKSITMGVVKGVAMTVLPVVAGVVAAPLIFGAAGAGGAGAAAGAAAGAIPGTTGAAVGAAAGGAVAPGVTLATVLPAALPAAIAPAAALTTATGGTVAVAAPAVAGSSAGILGTGLTATQAAGLASTAVGAVKTAMSLASGHQTAANNLATQGNIPAADANALLAQQYRDQANQIASEAGLTLPGLGNVPLWVLILAGAAVFLSMNKRRRSHAP